eukprot:CAMPEP_0196661372 /NCGR_PEP_ID=MMETSP1086-20130531/43909_1 /TAXON_ID=77921 /ORGANISM="Cyanoptyche  gloeocystis , Strain SAG4.97" /LENGTH=287 /DNA_ID=CAMNT_0041996225 /DNA_START=862 /DNA_END=1722 /DNA_ORIENTATION=+
MAHGAREYIKANSGVATEVKLPDFDFLVAKQDFQAEMEVLDSRALGIIRTDLKDGVFGLAHFVGCGQHREGVEVLHAWVTSEMNNPTARNPELAHVLKISLDLIMLAEESNMSEVRAFLNSMGQQIGAMSHLHFSSLIQGSLNDFYAVDHGERSALILKYCEKLLCSFAKILPPSSFDDAARVHRYALRRLEGLPFSLESLSESVHNETDLPLDLIREALLAILDPSSHVTRLSSVHLYGIGAYLVHYAGVNLEFLYGLLAEAYDNASGNRALRAQVLTTAYFVDLP